MILYTSRSPMETHRLIPTKSVYLHCQPRCPLELPPFMASTSLKTCILSMLLSAPYIRFAPPPPPPPPTGPHAYPITASRWAQADLQYLSFCTSDRRGCLDGFNSLFHAPVPALDSVPHVHTITRSTKAACCVNARLNTRCRGVRLGTGGGGATPSRAVASQICRPKYWVAEL